MSRVDEAFLVIEGDKAPASLPAQHNGQSKPSSGSGLEAYSREVPPAAQSHEPLDNAIERGRRRPGRPAPSTPEHSSLVTHRLATPKLVTADASVACIEQYRRLAAVLQEGQATRALKTVMVTSALPFEGKTLTTINLALTLAESYARRVLVVDADLRRPSIHEAIGISNERGLSEALGNGALPLPVTKISDSLSVLTAGRPGPAPLAALSSARMAALLQQCAAQFDWVLLDTPPVGLMPDAQVLARLTDGVLLVIAVGIAPAAAVAKTVEDLGSDCILGTVLNRVDDSQIAQAGYYDRYPHDLAQVSTSSTNP